jgi:hypothetical protein
MNMNNNIIATISLEGSYQSMMASCNFAVVEQFDDDQ